MTSEELDQPDRPKRGPNPRLETSATLVAIPGVSGGTARLLNLSTAGACVELEADRVEAGQSLELKLAHPRLRVVPVVPGEVAWVDESRTGATRFGVRFLEPSEADNAVRPFLTAEAGSCLFQGPELVGFAVPHGKAKKAWSLFEASGKRLSVAARDDTGYEVHAKTGRAGSLPSFHVPSLYEAICKSIGVEEPLRLDPAISGWRADLAPQDAAEAGPVTEAEPVVEEPAPRDAPGQAVSGPSGPLGFLCETVMPGSWLLVDQQGKQVAYVASSGPNEYQIASMGDAIDDELEFQVFPDLVRAVATAFQLESTEGVEIGETKTVGRVTPIRVKDSESSVDLDQGAVQVTLTGYPTLQGPPQRPVKRPVQRPAQAAARPARARSGKAKGFTKEDQAKRTVPIFAGVLALVLMGYILQALWTLILTYTS